MTHAFDRIVIGTDFSDTSERALQYAVGLAARLGARVDVVHAYAVTSFALPIEGAVMAGAEQAAALSVRLGQQLNELVARHRSTASVPIDGHLRLGAADDELLAFAAETGGTLIVVGTHGRTGAAHLLLGSVAERVVRKSSVPVLTVGRSGPA